MVTLKTYVMAEKKILDVRRVQNKNRTEDWRRKPNNLVKFFKCGKARHNAYILNNAKVENSRLTGF